MHEIHFRILRMERTAMNAATAWASYHDGNSGTPAIPALCCEVRDLIKDARNEVRELHFGDRPHTHQGCAYRRPDDTRFRNRCIDDAPFAESLDHTGGDLERAAV